jgi:predicted  nucleic acid-binding Zn-ribbon protein
MAAQDSPRYNNAFNDQPPAQMPTSFTRRNARTGVDVSIGRRRSAIVAPTATMLPPRPPPRRPDPHRDRVKAAQQELDAAYEEQVAALRADKEKLVMEHQNATERMATGHLDAVKGLDGRIDRLLLSSETQKGEITSLRSDKAELQSQISNLQIGNEALGEEFTQLESQISELEGEKEVLEDNVFKLESQVSEMQGEKEVLETNISNLQSQISSLETEELLTTNDFLGSYYNRKRVIPPCKASLRSSSGPLRMQQPLHRA